MTVTSLHNSSILLFSGDVELILKIENWFPTTRPIFVVRSMFPAKVNNLLTIRFLVRKREVIDFRKYLKRESEVRNLQFFNNKFEFSLIFQQTTLFRLQESYKKQILQILYWKHRPHFLTNWRHRNTTNPSSFSFSSFRGIRTCCPAEYVLSIQG